MSQKQKTLTENIAAVETAGRELLDTALQRNPLVALASSVVTPIANLIRGRRPKPAASVRKMRLESYSYSPVRKESGRRAKPRPDSGRLTKKGGSHHGQA